MFVKRSVEEIIEDALRLLPDNTPINNLYAGGIARSIVESIAREIGVGVEGKANLYDFAQDVLHQGFLSKAKGEHLELIGGLFSYPRRTREVIDEETGVIIEEEVDDETYRYELSQRVHTAVSANEEALRLALLTINGVQDIIGKEYTHGTGSFSFIVVLQNGYDEEIMRVEILEKINEVKGYGIHPHIAFPESVHVDLTIQPIFHESATDRERDAIRFAIQNGLRNFFGKLSLGEGFIYNEVVKEVMNINEKLIDFEIMAFYLNDEVAMLTNHSINEDERIRPRFIEVI